MSHHPEADDSDSDDLAALDFSADDQDVDEYDDDEYDDDEYDDETDQEEEADELDPFTVSVTNPPGTVTISAIVDGSIRQIDLTPQVVGMTEQQLAEEILVLAGLAREKGLAAQRTYLMQNQMLNEMITGVHPDGREFLVGFIDEGMNLPTPEAAQATEAEVFANRYAGER